MAPEPPAASTQIGQEARGVIGQTVIGTTVIYGSVTIIQGQASQLGPAASAAPASESPSADEPNPYQGLLAFQPADGDRGVMGRRWETASRSPPAREWCRA